MTKLFNPLDFKKLVIARAASASNADGTSNGETYSLLLYKDGFTSIKLLDLPTIDFHLERDGRWVTHSMDDEEFAAFVLKWT